MAEPYTRDLRGGIRVLIEDTGSRTYYEVSYLAEPTIEATIEREIIWVRTSRVAYNNAIRKHGRNLLNIVNLETGELVMGATR